MRLPAVAIAAVFTAGIALGLHPAVAPHATSGFLLAFCFAASLVLIVVGLTFAKSGRLIPAATVSVLSWLFLGFLSACVAEQPRPANHVVSLLEHKHLSLESPLRWQGRLRDEPAKTPWGYGLEIDLSGVEFEAATLPVQGGLRVNFSPHAEQAPLPELHAGDEVSVLIEAKLPQVFRDEGAFDRREYLAQQNTDLVATLRSREFIERVGTSKHSFATHLAQLRSQLREEIDTLCNGSPQTAGVLRAMLLGDRSFVDRAESADFQKTGAFHVLAVAGLHVGRHSGCPLLGRAKTTSAAFAGDTTHTGTALCLCRHRGRAPASLARGDYDRSRLAGRLLLPAVGAVEFSRDRSANSLNCKTYGLARFQFSTDVCGHGLHRRTGCALAGKDSATLCPGIARLERCDPGCST